MEKELRDYFKIDDSHSRIRGFVIIKDADGRILVKKENMIVKSGRKMIFDLVKGTSTRSISPNVKALFSSNAELTISNMEFDDCECIINDMSVSVKTPEYDNEELTMLFKINAESTVDYDLNSLVLYRENGSEKELFSRVVFDTIQISASSKLHINYYIYF